MPLHKGGRGHKAPYDTVVIRVPKPIEASVLGLISAYRDNSLLVANDLPIEAEVITKAKEILKDKKNARISLTKLLQFIYPNSEINL